ncbi:MAG: glycosyltransferase family 2 protein, partial [Clostridia bacterium]|nr:glycosyltransferase family 2 protein [Clostridia bacterium]
CGTKATDTTSGFRATNKELTAFFSREYAQDYPEPEAIVAASLNGYRVKDVAVKMKEREGGVSSINAKRSLYYMIKVSLALIILRIGTKRRKKK